MGIPITDAEASFRGIDTCVLCRPAPRLPAWLDWGSDIRSAGGVTGTAGARSCLMSFATGPSSSISARDKTRKLGYPPVAARAKLLSSLRMQPQPQPVAAVRCLAPPQALPAAPTAPAPIGQALILPGIRLGSPPRACPRQDPPATPPARSRGEAAPWLAATATSGLIWLAAVHVLAFAGS